MITLIKGGTNRARMERNFDIKTLCKTVYPIKIMVCNINMQKRFKKKFVDKTFTHAQHFLGSIINKCYVMYKANLSSYI